MKEMRNWMRAAILTLCGTITFTMTSCSADDNSTSVQQPELSSYTVEQIKAYAQGTWLDEIQLTDDSAVRLYDINEDGHCDIYDFNFNEESEDEEGLGSYVTYNGTWSVTNDLSKLHFVDQLNFNDLELIGGLQLKVKKKIDENDETYKVFKEHGLDLNAEMMDTLAMLRDKTTGDMAFISHTDAYLLALLNETGQLVDEEASATMRTKAANRSYRKYSIEERIKMMIESNELTMKSLSQKYNNKKIDNADYMGRYYKGLNPRICDMSILGAGGAPTAYITKDLGESVYRKYKRQFLSIKELWNLGVRYFDLGTIYGSEKGAEDLGFYDEDMKYRYPNVTLKQILGDLKEMLDQHPTETAIIMIDQAPNLDKKMMYDVYLEISNTIGSVFDIYHKAINYSPDLRLDDCRGLLIVMNNFENPVHNPSLGVCMRPVWSKDIKTAEVDFPVVKKNQVTVQACNFISLYDNIDKKDKVMQTLKIADESAKSVEPHWVINHMSGRVGVPGLHMSYLVGGSLTNEFVGKDIIKMKLAKTGIMVVDFVGIDYEDSYWLFKNPCGVDLIAPIIGANYYASKNHLISLDEGDVVK
jgi:hypothetical protein